MLKRIILSLTLVATSAITLAQEVKTSEITLIEDNAMLIKDNYQSVSIVENLHTKAKSEFPDMTNGEFLSILVLSSGENSIDEHQFMLMLRQYFMKNIDDEILTLATHINKRKQKAIEDKLQSRQ